MFQHTDLKRIFGFYKPHGVWIDQWNMSATDALWFVYILSQVLDDTISLKSYFQIPQKKHSLLHSSLKILILTKYKAKLRAIVSFNYAITTYLIAKPEQWSNMSLDVAP